MRQNKTEVAEESVFSRGIFYAARQSIRHHATGGNVLIAATVLALAVANMPWINSEYFEFWNQEVRLQIGDFNVFSHAGHAMTLLQFINDALMAIFFFSIGLEIKREVLVGELSSFRQALLPIIGAIGGMACPVAVFWLFAHGTEYASGAAIPMATDIAFSLGVLALLGKRVPLSLMMLFYAALLFGVLLLGSRLRIKSKAFYIGVGGVIWFLFLNSGIHPTIAGVLVAFCVPATPVYAPNKYIRIIRKSISNFKGDDEDNAELEKRTILSNEQMNWLKKVESASDKVISPLQDLEDTLHPLVNYIILPLFAFANAGILLLGMEPASVFEGISLSIICGLVAGKFVGILLFSWLAVRMRLAPMPAHANWNMMAATAMLGGIGFTVSLFIATLSFGTPAEADLLEHAKLGIVVGSLLSGTCAALWLHMALPKGQAPDTEDDEG